MKGLPFLMFTLVLLISSNVAARTWYVTLGGTGDAPTIQAGIDSAAVGDTVLVAAGTYTEICQSGAAMLVIDSGMYLIAEDGADATVLDAQGSCRVIYISSVSDSVFVEGFTVTGGDAGGGPGGGLYCYDCQALIRRCLISGNAATYGGGLYAGGDGISIADCEICHNTAAMDNHGWGGGAYCIEATMIGCNVHDNYASEEGGGVYNSGNTTECVFSGNSAGWAGGAFGGGDVSDCFLVNNTCYCVASWGLVEDCVFTQNSGSCIYTYWLHSGPHVRNCTFYGNSGNAVRVDGASYARVTNCTVYGNRGDALVVVPGWSHGDGTYLRLSNTIVAYTTGGRAVRSCTTNECNVIMECCCLWQNEDGDYVGGIEGQEGVNGNFSGCPSFCHSEPGDFHLCDESPCLPGNHPDGYECGLIGAWGEGCSCGPSQSVPTTWGEIKTLFR